MIPFKSAIFVVAILVGAEVAFPQLPSKEQSPKIVNPLAFKQEDFANFTRISFLPPTNATETAVQNFKIKAPARGGQEVNARFGISFTVPDWLDGDVKLNFFHLNPKEQSRRRVGFISSMYHESAKYLRHDILRIDPDDTQDFWRRYPHTRRVYAVTIERKQLQPGQSYALILSHFEQTPPDVAIALTIDSERGRQEFGSLSYMSGPTGKSGLSEVEPSAAFVQSNWTNFPMVTFLPPTNGSETVFRDFKTSENLLGDRFAGVRFTVPEWLDGDLKFAFVHCYRSHEELRRRPGYSWGILPERGNVPGMGKTERVFFAKLPEMRARFPFTEKGYAGSAQRYSLVPGRTYVLWWSHQWNHKERVLPDVALALTIASDRGRKEFGEITWR